MGPIEEWHDVNRCYLEQDRHREKDMRLERLRRED